MELDLLSLNSVVRFAEAWNARMGPLHVLINNAGMFSIGGWSREVSTLNEFVLKSLKLPFLLHTIYCNTYIYIFNAF